MFRLNIQNIVTFIYILHSFSEAYRNEKKNCLLFFHLFNFSFEKLKNFIHSLERRLIFNFIRHFYAIILGYLARNRKIKREMNL